MPLFRIADFPGTTEDEREAACFEQFTRRQKARLAALEKREELSSKDWPAIFLEPMEYKRWVNLAPEHGKLHDDIEVFSSRNKYEREEHKKANIEKGKSMAKRPPIPATDEPAAKKPSGISCIYFAYP